MPLTCCVTSGKSPDFSEPRFSYVKWNPNIELTSLRFPAPMTLYPDPLTPPPPLLPLTSLHRPGPACRTAEELRKGSRSDFFRLSPHSHRPVEGASGNPEASCPQTCPRQLPAWRETPSGWNPRCQGRRRRSSSNNTREGQRPQAPPGPGGCPGLGRRPPNPPARHEAPRRLGPRAPGVTHSSCCSKPASLGCAPR